MDEPAVEVARYLQAMGGHAGGVAFKDAHGIRMDGGPEGRAL